MGRERRRARGGLDLAIQTATCHFLERQHLDAEAFVDARRYRFFDAVLAPLP